jgi:8-oxo-dGTP diphosphatase
VAALVRSPKDDKYLLLRRSAEKDFAAGAWECVTGRVDQGEGFEDALHREVMEELGVTVQVEFVIGTTHFHRGENTPENELIGVIYACALDDPAAIRTSAEHSEQRWVTAEEADALLTDLGPTTQWIRRVIQRAEAIRQLVPPDRLQLFREHGFELG